MARFRRVPSPCAGWLAAAITLASVATFPEIGAAQTKAWVSGDRVLNLRTGAREDDRAIGVLRTGDEVTLLSRDGGWAKVRDAREREGWVLGAYLQSEPPRALVLEQRLESLREELETSRQEVEALQAENEKLTAADQERETEIQRLTRDNLELRAGERWPFLIAGASILGVGVLVGIILHWATAKRSQPRIRF